MKNKINFFKILSRIDIKFLILGAVFYAFLNFSYQYLTKDKAPPPQEQKHKFHPVEASYVRKSLIKKKINVIGYLTPSRKVLLKNEIKGQVSQVFAIGGTRVDQDDPLIQIDDTPYKAQVKELEATLKYHQQNLERIQQLASQNFIAQKKLKEAETQVETTKAKLDTALYHLKRTTIVAPFSGVISLFDIYKGTYLEPNQKLFTIMDTDPMKVDFHISSYYTDFIFPGQKINIYVESISQKPFTGVIEGIDPAIDKNTASFLVRAKITNSSDFLTTGLFAKVEVVVGTKSNAIVVPEEAIEIDGEEKYIYKIIKDKDGNNVGYRTIIKTGITENRNVEIIKGGIRNGDMIISSGWFKLQKNHGFVSLTNLEDIINSEEENT